MENSVSQSKYSKISPNWMFFIYFTVMFLFYMQTYIQLGIQLFIIAYVVLTKFFNGKIIIKKNSLDNAKFFTLWFGLFTILMFLSTLFWAYSTLEGSKTMIGLFRSYFIGVSMYLYADTTEKALSIMQAFALASVIMGVAAMITTPVSQYFQAGDEGFGQVIGQQRNLIGAVSTYMIFTCYFLKKYTNFKYGYFLCAFFVMLTIITGSRSAIVQLLILLAMFTVFDKKFLKMVTKLIGVLLLLVIVIFALKKVPILYDNIWIRFEQMLATMTGNEMADASTLGRQFYREIAFEMFKQRPILGWGLDGFTCYLRDNPIHKGYYIEAVYSHCSWAEIMASLGIVGLIAWYAPNLYVLIINIKNFNYHPIMKFTCFLLVSLLILDYARLPWMSHAGCYQFFVLFLLIINMAREAKNAQNHLT